MTGPVHGRIPLNDAEAAAVDTLCENDTTACITRRDPGETGPVLVYAHSATYEVAGTGEVTKLQ